MIHTSAKVKTMSAGVMSTKKKYPGLLEFKSSGQEPRVDEKFNFSNSN